MRRSTERREQLRAPSRSRNARGVLALIAASVLLLCVGAPLAAVLAGPQDARPQASGEGGLVRGTVLGAGDRPIPFVRMQVSGNGVSETVLTREDGTFEAALPRVVVQPGERLEALVEPQAAVDGVVLELPAEEVV